MQNKDQLLQQSIFHSLKKIAQDHLDQQRKSREEELQPIFEVLNELTEEEKQQLTQTYQSISTNLQTLEKGVKEAEKEIDDEIAKIMKNAYLMPFQTRELAEAFLEAAQPEFKVGFLFSKQKTLDEKNARLDRLYQDLVDKTKSQLEWHLREYLMTVLKNNGLDNPELQSKAQSFSIEVPIDLIVQTVKQGAMVSGEYVLHYTEDLANGIKKIARDGILDFKEALIPALELKTNQLTKMYQEEFQNIEQYVDAIAERTKFEQETANTEAAVSNLLNESIDNKANDHSLFNQEEEEAEVIHGHGQPLLETKEVKKNKPLLPDSKNECNKENRNRSSKKSFAKHGFTFKSISKAY